MQVGGAYGAIKYSYGGICLPLEQDKDIYWHDIIITLYTN